MQAERNRPRLAPEPRPSTDAEPRLHSLVLLPIFHRCPDEQAADKNGGQDDDEQNKNDRGRGVHKRRSSQWYVHQAEWKYAATSTYAPAVAVAVVAVSVEAGRPENSSRHSLVSRGQGKRVAVPPLCDNRRAIN
jgi:hypothetical protein